MRSPAFICISSITFVSRPNSMPIHPLTAGVRVVAKRRFIDEIRTLTCDQIVKPTQTLTTNCCWYTGKIMGHFGS